MPKRPTTEYAGQPDRAVVVITDPAVDLTQVFLAARRDQALWRDPDLNRSFIRVRLEQGGASRSELVDLPTLRIRLDTWLLDNLTAV